MTTMPKPTTYEERMTKPTKVKEGEGPLQFMRDNAPTKQLNVRIDQDLLKELKIRAIDSNQSLQDYIIGILEDSMITIIKEMGE